MKLRHMALNSVQTFQPGNFQEDALTPSQLESVVKLSKAYVANKGVMAHSGQQDDLIMEQVEFNRKKLRERK